MRLILSLVLGLLSVAPRVVLPAEIHGQPGPVDSFNWRQYGIFGFGEDAVAYVDGYPYQWVDFYPLSAGDAGPFDHDVTFDLFGQGGGSTNVQGGYAGEVSGVVEAGYLLHLDFSNATGELCVSPSSCVIAYPGGDADEYGWPGVGGGFDVSAAGAGFDGVVGTRGADGVPEPATAALLLLAVFVLVGAYRRRRVVGVVAFVGLLACGSGAFAQYTRPGSLGGNFWEQYGVENQGDLPTIVVDGAPYDFSAFYPDQFGDLGSFDHDVQFTAYGGGGASGDVLGGYGATVTGTILAGHNVHLDFSDNKAVVTTDTGSVTAGTGANGTDGGAGGAFDISGAGAGFTGLNGTKGNGSDDGQQQQQQHSLPNIGLDVPAVVSAFGSKLGGTVKPVVAVFFAFLVVGVGVRWAAGMGGGSASGADDKWSRDAHKSGEDAGDGTVWAWGGEQNGWMRAVDEAG